MGVLFLKHTTRASSQELIEAYYESQASIEVPVSPTPVDTEVMVGSRQDDIVEAPLEEEVVEEVVFPDSYKEGDVMGILRIPKMGLEVALCEGVSYKTLKFAVGHFKETARPGEIGNRSEERCVGKELTPRP